MSGLLGRVSAGNGTAPVAAGFKVQTSVYGLPLPIVYGTARVAGNLIHMADPRQVAQLSPGSRSKLIKVDQQIQGYSYTAAIALGLAEGPIVGVGKVWKDKESPDTFTNYQSLGWSLFLGSIAQSPWAYLATNHPAEAPPYQFLAYVAHPTADLPNNVLANYGWEVQGLAIFGGTIVDALPSAILSDFLTDAQHGVGFPSAQLGSLTAFATYCRAMGLFLSPVMNGQAPASDAVAQLLEASNVAAVWYDNQLNFLPYGDTPVTGNGVTYTPNTTPLYDLTDDDFIAPKGTDPIVVQRKRASEAFNQFLVEYEDRVHDYNPNVAEAKDQAAIEAYQLRPAPTLRMPAIKDAATARLIAQLRLQREQHVRGTYRFTLPMRYALLTPMDLVTLTDVGLGFTKLPVRLTAVEESETGLLACEAEDWPFGVASASRYGAAGAAGFKPQTNVAPGSTSAITLDAPYTLTAPDFQLWIAATGGTNWGGCDVYFSTDNMNFKRVGAIVGKAAMGALRLALATGSAYPTQDVANTLAVDLAASGATLASVSADDVAALLSLCYVDGEFVAYRDAVLHAANQYDLSTLERGLYGSAVPSSHAIGAPFAVLDARVFRLSFPNAVNGQTVYFKFPAFNVYGAAAESLASAASVPHIIVANPATQGVELLNFREVAHTADTETFGWVRGPKVAAVYAGLVTFPLPLPADPWAIVRDAVGPLDGGVNQIVVPKPVEGYATLGQVEPRRAGDFLEGRVEHFRVDAAPAGAPVVTSGYSKTDTLGTLYMKLQLRGLDVVGVQGQSQVALAAPSAPGAPTRGAGATSVYTGLVMGAYEYELDSVLDQTRLTGMWFDVTLSSGDVLRVGPQWFDRNRVPTIVAATVSGTVISGLGDVDVKSWKAKDMSPGGTWEYAVDGQACVIDASQVGTNGAAGIPSASTWPVRLFAYPDFVSAVPPTGGPQDQRDLTIGGATAPATPTWAVANLSAPATIPGTNVKITLKASSAPVGSTVKLWESHNDGSGTWSAYLDVTASVTPAAGGLPPTTQTDYAWSAGAARSHEPGYGGHAPFSAPTYHQKIRAEILNGSGTVIATATLETSWYYGGYYGP